MENTARTKDEFKLCGCSDLYYLHSQLLWSQVLSDIQVEGKNYTWLLEIFYNALDYVEIFVCNGGYFILFSSRK